MTKTPWHAVSLTAAIALCAGIALFPNQALASPPEITSFTCPLMVGGGAYQCLVTFSGGDGTTVTWSQPGLVRQDITESLFFGTCQVGTRQTVTVTVSNAQGSAQATATFKCWG
jgi:hypothetical protein